MARNYVGLNLIGCTTIAMVFIIGVTKAREYMVGDNFGWNVPTNERFYIDWARSKRFYVGDKLKFVVDTDNINGTVFNWYGEHSLGIRKDAMYYENCNTDSEGGLTYIFNGSTTNYTILESGPLYFICTIGDHCLRGQKLSINAQYSSSAPKVLSYGTLSATFLSTLAVLYFFTVTC